MEYGMLYQSNRTLLFCLLLFFFSFNVFALIEYEYDENRFFCIDKDEEAVIRLVIKNGNEVKDEYNLVYSAADSTVRDFRFITSNGNRYLFVEYDHGAFATMRQNEKVDLYVFMITDSKFNLVRIINLRDISYNPRTSEFYANRRMSYFYNEKKHSIELFDQIYGDLVLTEIHSL
jgi:hypothetical protein